MQGLLSFALDICKLLSGYTLHSIKEEINMEEKKLWSIDRMYIHEYTACDGSNESCIQADPIGTVLATEEEINKAIDLDWNKPSIRDEQSGMIYRPIEATELNIGGIDVLETILVHEKPNIELLAM